MPAVRIEPGSELEVGILGSDVDVVAYEVTSPAAGIATKAAVIAEIPGDLGEPSQDAPNAILIRKRFGGFLSVESDGNWSALGYAIYRSNNSFSGGQRTYAAYARRLSNLSLPIWQYRYTYNDANEATLRWVLNPITISRPVSSRVKTKILGGFTEDDFAEAVDPLVGAVFYFIPNGQPYILAGADGFITPGSPLRAEYRFLTSGRVPGFDAGSTLLNDLAIPPLGPLMEYTQQEQDNNGIVTPVVSTIDPTALYIVGDLAQLPGF